MSIVVEDRPDGSFALSLDGDLQFDSRDEAIYHENLVLPALSLAAKRGLTGLRVLICGGGDGLALREILRFPGVARVDLVDLSQEVIDLGRTRFAELNGGALADSRVSVHIADAWDFLESAGTYDVIVADFSVPRKSAEARVFTAEWYSAARRALAPLGVLAINAVSPQVTPAAFWSQVRSVRACGLRAVPLRSCIPSFRERGYGAWGLILASSAPLTSASIRHLTCPVPTRQTDLRQLWRAARFSRAERMLGHLVPVHRIDRPCLVDLLLNGQAESGSAEPWANLPAPLRALFEALPVSHPYHTRLMVQTLASSIVGDLSRIRLGNLLDELLKRASRLPKTIADELRRLRLSFADWASWQNWNAKILGALILVLTLANTLAPDHAFAKGHASFGHASMSRMGSFGRSGEFGTASPVSSVSIRGTGFRSSRLGTSPNGRPGVVDMEGNVYPSRTFYYSNYYGGGYGYGGYGYGYGGYGYGGYGYGNGYGNGVPQGNGARAQNQSATPHAPVFVVDDDMLVMENGDIVITLSSDAFLVASNGHLSLMGPSRKPLLELAFDPTLAASIKQELSGRLQNAQSEAQLRRDWLSWVNWTSVILEQTRDDKRELKNLESLGAQLTVAQKRLGDSTATPFEKPTDATVVFVGCLLYDSKIQFRLADGSLATWDGASLAGTKGPIVHTPPELKDVFKAVIAKLSVQLRADVRANQADKMELDRNEASLRQDEQSYRQYMNYYGANYSVDYGTDEMPVSQALDLTERDITQSAAERAANLAELNQLTVDIKRIDSAIGWFR